MMSNVLLAIAFLLAPPADDSCYVPTPMEVVDKMMEVAEVGKDDVVYDLGSGDGRIVIVAAAKYGCMAVGYELDPELVELSRRNVERNGVSHLVTIVHQDVLTVDLKPATVVMVYLSSELNRKLLPQLKTLKPESRVVSHAHKIFGLSLDRTVKARCKDGLSRAIYLYRIKVGGGLASCLTQPRVTTGST